MLLFYFFLIVFSMITNSNTALHLLLTAELFWINLYIFFFLVSLIYNNINITSLTFLSLIFSAIELGIGLILLLIQNTLTRSVNLSENDNNHLKFKNRYKNKLRAKKINW